MTAGWLILGLLVGATLATRAQRHRIEALIEAADALIERVRVREIRRLLDERSWYSGTLHGVTIEVTPTPVGSWWITWSGPREADALVPDELLDGELMRWLRGPRREA